METRYMCFLFACIVNVAVTSLARWMLRVPRPILLRIRLSPDVHNLTTGAHGLKRVPVRDVNIDEVLQRVVDARRAGAGRHGPV